MDVPRQNRKPLAAQLASLEKCSAVSLHNQWKYSLIIEFHHLNNAWWLAVDCGVGPIRATGSCLLFSEPLAATSWEWQPLQLLLAC